MGALPVQAVGHPSRMSRASNVQPEEKGGSVLVVLRSATVDKFSAGCRCCRQAQTGGCILQDMAVWVHRLFGSANVTVNALGPLA